MHLTLIIIIILLKIYQTINKPRILNPPYTLHFVAYELFLIGDYLYIQVKKIFKYVKQIMFVRQADHCQGLTHYMWLKRAFVAFRNPVFQNPHLIVISSVACVVFAYILCEYIKRVCILYNYIKKVYKTSMENEDDNFYQPTSDSEINTSVNNKTQENNNKNKKTKNKKKQKK